jgi:hypothetical protein
MEIVNKNQLNEDKNIIQSDDNVLNNQLSEVSGIVSENDLTSQKDITVIEDINQPQPYTKSQLIEDFYKPKKGEVLPWALGYVKQQTYATKKGKADQDYRNEIANQANEAFYQEMFVSQFVITERVSGYFQYEERFKYDIRNNKCAIEYYNAKWILSYQINDLDDFNRSFLYQMQKEHNTSLLLLLGNSIHHGWNWAIIEPHINPVTLRPEIPLPVKFFRKANIEFKIWPVTETQAKEIESKISFKEFWKWLKSYKKIKWADVFEEAAKLNKILIEKNAAEDKLVAKKKALYEKQKKAKLDKERAKRIVKGEKRAKQLRYIEKSIQRTKEAKKQRILAESEENSMFEDEINEIKELHTIFKESKPAITDLTNAFKLEEAKIGTEEVLCKKYRDSYYKIDYARMYINYVRELVEKTAIWLKTAQKSIDLAVNTNPSHLMGLRTARKLASKDIRQMTVELPEIERTLKEANKARIDAQESRLFNEEMEKNTVEIEATIPIPGKVRKGPMPNVKLEKLRKLLPWILSGIACVASSVYIYKRLTILKDPQIREVWRKYGKEAYAQVRVLCIKEKPEKVIYNVASLDKMVLALDFPDLSLARLTTFRNMWRKARLNKEVGIGGKSASKIKMSDFLKTPPVKALFDFILPDKDLTFYGVNLNSSEYKKYEIGDLTVEQAYKKFQDKTHVMVIQNPLDDAETKKLKMSNWSRVNYEYYARKHNLYLTRFPTCPPKKFMRSTRRLFEYISSESRRAHNPAVTSKTLQDFFASKKIRRLFDLPEDKRVDVEIYDKISLKLLQQLDLNTYTVKDLKYLLNNSSLIIHIYDLSRADLKTRIDNILTVDQDVKAIIDIILNNIRNCIIGEIGDTIPLLPDNRDETRYTPNNRRAISNLISRLFNHPNETIHNYRLNSGIIPEQIEILQNFYNANDENAQTIYDLIVNPAANIINVQNVIERVLAENLSNSTRSGWLEEIQIPVALRDSLLHNPNATRWTCRYCDEDISNNLELHHIWPRTAPELNNEQENLLDGFDDELFEDLPRGLDETWNLVYVCRKHAHGSAITGIRHHSLPRSRGSCLLDETMFKDAEGNFINLNRGQCEEFQDLLIFNHYLRYLSNLDNELDFTSLDIYIPE